jgi:hypothetical protein
MDTHQGKRSILSARQHWLCLFTPETWEIALRDGCSQAAFTASRLKTASRIRSGDFLYIYLLQRKVLCGCLIAIIPVRQSKADSIYSPAGKFPIVLPTAPNLLLPADRWLPIEDLIGSLILFRGLRKPSLWQHALRNSPRSLRSSDGELIYRKMKECMR